MPKTSNSQPDHRPQVTDPQTGKASDHGLPITDHRSASGRKRKVVLAIASAGGHWIQLRRLHPAFAGTRLIYSTTREAYQAEVEEEGAAFRVVPDCNRWQKIKLLKAAMKIFILLLKEKPDVVISTGAAPGYFAIRLGKLLGKKTIWVDSIANAEELSLSGQRAGQHVDHWITQWKHLAHPDGPHFYGNVLGDEVGATVPSGPNQHPAPANHQPHAPHSSQSDEGSAPSAISHQSSDAVSNQQSAISHQLPSEATHLRSEARKTLERPLRVFVTVGTDLPFNRLVKALDEWAPAHPNIEVYAQIGETTYQPKNIPYCQFIEPPEFKKRFQEADLIVSHAGMGTILSSLSYQKPLLVMPRIAAKGEHRNEHQLATAKHLQELNKINVAQDEKKLLTILESLVPDNQPPVPRSSESKEGSAISHQPSPPGLSAKEQISQFASATLTSKLNEFINAE